MDMTPFTLHASCLLLVMIHAVFPCNLVQVLQDFPFDTAKAAAAILAKKDGAILSKKVGMERLA